MKRIILILAFLLLGLSACSSAPVDEKAVDIRLDKIIFDGVSFDIDFYIDRLDKGLRQPINDENDLYTSDLPTALQPKSIYLSNGLDTEKSSGIICSTAYFPHRCSASLDGDVLLDNNFLLKITFMDGLYVAKPISFTTPLHLENPEIVEMESAPKQGSNFHLKFKDVEADSYTVSVSLCKEYENNGINPCLDGTEYELIREGDGLILRPNLVEAGYYDLDDPIVSISDGIVDVNSKFPLFYEKSIEFDVNAVLEGKNADGITTRSESFASKAF